MTIECPECGAQAEKVMVFGKEFIQCDKGHKTVVEQEIRERSDVNGIILEESTRNV